MEESRYSSRVLEVMKNLNLLAIVYLSVIIAYGLQGFIRENTALDFLAQIYRMPIAAFKIPVLAISLYVSFLLLMYLQSKSSARLFIKVCVEL